MIRRPPRSTLDRSSAASDVYKRQVHEGTVLPEGEFVFERLPGLNRFLRKPSYSVHPIGQDDAVPVHARRRWQIVSYIDTHPITFHHFDRRPVHLFVVTPAMSPKRLVGRGLRHKLVIHLVNREMKDLHTVHQLPRGGGAVKRDRGLVMLARLAWLRVRLTHPCR